MARSSPRVCGLGEIHRTQVHAALIFASDMLHNGIVSRVRIHTTSKALNKRFCFPTRNSTYSWLYVAIDERFYATHSGSTLDWCITRQQEMQQSPYRIPFYGP